MSSYPWAAGYIDDGDRPKVVTSRFQHDDSYTLERYHATGGYQGLKAALQRTPAEVHDEVKNATVLGRGGAGFPAGTKWGLTPAGKFPRYLVVNGDESEPGTYKDRLLMERDPHQLIEGVLLACYAIGAGQAFLYVRGEMALAQERIAQALNEAYKAAQLNRYPLSAAHAYYLATRGSARAAAPGLARPAAGAARAAYRPRDRQQHGGPPMVAVFLLHRCRPPGVHAQTSGGNQARPAGDSQGHTVLRGRA